MSGETKELAVLGLGSMGSAMAKNLAKAGFRLRVWNRTASKARELLKDLPGARLCETPREAADGAGFILTSLANDEAVRDVAFGDDGFKRGIGAGAIHLETSTISLALSRELEETWAKQGSTFVASHVFGRPEAAEARKLWVAAGGPAKALDRAKPIFEAISQGHFRFDTPPQATLMKLCGNLLIASTIEMLGEALALGEKGGIDPEDAMRVIGAVFGNSPVVTGYGTRIARGSFEPAGFKMKLGFKDVSLALESGTDLGVPLPLASLVHDHLVAMLARGCGDLDWSALSSIVRVEAGLPEAAH